MLGDVAAIGYSVKAAPIRFFFDGDKAPHFRCPPGTRRSGKWTDRLGTDCELGGARVALARIGERMQNIAHGEGGRGGKNPALPTVGERLEFRLGRAAHAVDGGAGSTIPGGKKKRRGVATALGDAAHAIDGGAGSGKKKRGLATALGDAADAVDGGAGRKKRRGLATALGDAADAVDGGAGRKKKPPRQHRILDVALAGHRRRVEDGVNVVGRKRGPNAKKPVPAGGRKLEGALPAGTRDKVKVPGRGRSGVAAAVEASVDTTAARSVQRQVARTATNAAVDESVGVRRRANARANPAIGKMNREELVAHRVAMQDERKALEKERNGIRKALRAGDGPPEGFDTDADAQKRIVELNGEIEKRRAAVNAVDKRLDKLPDAEPAPAKKAAKKAPAKKVVKKKAVKKRAVAAPTPAPAEASAKKPSLRPSTRVEPQAAPRSLSAVEADMAAAQAEIARADAAAARHNRIANAPIRRNPPPEVQSNLTEWRQAERDRPDIHRGLAAAEKRKADEAQAKYAELVKERDALRRAEPAKKAPAKKVVKKAVKRPARPVGGQNGQIQDGVTPAAPVKKAAPAKKAVKKAVRRRIPEGVTASEPQRAAWEKKGVVPKGEIRVNPALAKYDDAVAHIKAGGDIAEVPDEVVLEAMLDGDVKIPVYGGRNFSWEDILTPNYGSRGATNNLPRMRKGMKLENSRFKFECIKEDSHGRDVWTVFKVKDKQTGRTYFLKASVYGHHDAMLEDVGADAMRIAGFPIDEKRGQIRMGRMMKGHHSNRELRWSLQPHVAAVVHDAKEGPAAEAQYKDWGLAARHPDVRAIDMARIWVVDFLFDNEDRHGENIKVYTHNGETRVAPIDMGLIFGGRMGEMGDSGKHGTPEQFMARAEERGAFSIAGYKLNTRNAPFNRLAVTTHHGARWTPAKRAEAQAEIRRLIERFDKMEIDAFFDPERIERRGVTLSDGEKAHLLAMRRVFELRLATLKKEGPAGILHAAKV